MRECETDRIMAECDQLPEQDCCDPSDQHDLGVIARIGADVRPAIPGLHAGLHHRWEFDRVRRYNHG